MHFSALLHFTGLHFTITLPVLDLPCIIIYNTLHTLHTLLTVDLGITFVRIFMHFINDIQCCWLLFHSLKTKNDKNDDYRPLDLFFSFIIHNFYYYTIIYTICILLYLYNYVIISDIIFPKKHLI